MKILPNILCIYRTNLIEHMRMAKNITQIPYIIFVLFRPYLVTVLCLIKFVFQGGNFLLRNYIKFIKWEVIGFFCFSSSFRESVA
jgi:hypothetical protein